MPPRDPRLSMVLHRSVGPTPAFLGGALAILLGAWDYLPWLTSPALWAGIGISTAAGARLVRTEGARPREVVAGILVGLIGFGVACVEVLAPLGEARPRTCSSSMVLAGRCRVGHAEGRPRTTKTRRFVHAITRNVLRAVPPVALALCLSGCTAVLDRRWPVPEKGRACEMVGHKAWSSDVGVSGQWTGCAPVSLWVDLAVLVSRPREADESRPSGHGPA